MTTVVSGRPCKTLRMKHASCLGAPSMVLQRTRLLPCLCPRGAWPGHVGGELPRDAGVTTLSYSHGSGGQDRTQSPGAEAQLRAGLVPWEAPWGIVSWLFQLLVAPCPLARGPCPIFKASSLASANLCLTLALQPPSYDSPGIPVGPWGNPR